jgi:hypothetical protein
MNTKNLCSFSMVVLSLAACSSDEPLTHSAPVGITINVKASEVAAGKLVADKNINTESGNPYGAFISNAKTALDGKDPARIALAGLTIALDTAKSSGVTTVGGVFIGACKIQFTMSGSGTVYPIGNKAFVAADGAGPISMTATFDSAAMPAADLSELIGGQFKMGIDCGAATTFTGNADATLITTMTFEAFDDL